MRTLYLTLQVWEGDIDISFINVFLCLYFTNSFAFFFFLIIFIIILMLSFFFILTLHFTPLSLSFPIFFSFILFPLVSHTLSSSLFLFLSSFSPFPHPFPLSSSLFFLYLVQLEELLVRITQSLKSDPEVWDIYAGKYSLYVTVQYVMLRYSMLQYVTL